MLKTMCSSLASLSGYMGYALKLLLAVLSANRLYGRVLALSINKAFNMLVIFLYF